MKAANSEQEAAAEEIRAELFGAALATPGGAEEFCRYCEPALFGDSFGAKLAAIIKEMHEMGERPTARTLRARVTGDPMLVEFDRLSNDGDYLATCIAAAPRNLDITLHANKLREIIEWQKRNPDERIDATPFQWKDPSSIPVRQWLHARHYIRRYVSATIAPGGAGKSSLLIIEALSIATGRALTGGKAPEQANVWIWNGEDPADELDRRIMAACKHYGIGRQEIEGRLFVNSGRTQPIIIAREDRSGVKIAYPVIESVKETIRKNNIGVMDVDPFVSCHAVNENDNGRIQMVGAQWAAIGEETDASISLAHHVRKTGGAEVTAEDGRGAGALNNTAPCVRVINVMSEGEAERAGIEVDERWRHFRVSDGKVNLAPRSSKANWYYLESVSLGNGKDGPDDFIGVVTSWDWPSPLDGISTRDLLAVQQKIERGRWKQNAQANDWAGIVVAEVLDLDLEEPKDKARAKALLKAWVSSGALTVVKEQDKSRHERPFIKVGQWAND